MRRRRELGFVGQNQNQNQNQNQRETKRGEERIGIGLLN